MKPTLDRGKTAAAAQTGVPAAVARPEPPRGTIAEWTITILLLLFGTTTLVQAFVIPTGSMEDTLLIGDHLLVDKLAYAPKGSFSKYILPYEEPQRRRHHRISLSRGYLRRPSSNASLAWPEIALSSSTSRSIATGRNSSSLM